MPKLLRARNDNYCVELLLNLLAL